MGNHKKVSGLSSVSIKSPIQSAPKTQTNVASAPVATVTTVNAPRQEAYGEEDFREGWRVFVRAHKKEALLYNAMIASFPKETGVAHQYEYEVENPAQKEKIEANMPELVKALRDFVKNDSITLSVKVRERKPGEKIWNQAELMHEAAERNPKVLEFIKKYNLSLA